MAENIELIDVTDFGDKGAMVSLHAHDTTIADVAKCGISITNFVLNSSMQMDDTIKGITLQVSGAYVPAADQAESMTESAIAADQAQDTSTE